MNEEELLSLFCYVVVVIIFLFIGRKKEAEGAESK